MALSTFTSLSNHYRCWFPQFFIVPNRNYPFPGGSDDKRICLQCRRPGFNPWVGKISWRRKWQPTPVFLPGKFHGQRGLVSYSPWGLKESDTTERLDALCMPHPPPPQSLVVNLYSTFPLNLPVLGTLYKWKHTIFVLLCLAYLFYLA